MLRHTELRDMLRDNFGGIKWESILRVDEQSKSAYVGSKEKLDIMNSFQVIDWGRFQIK